MTLQAPGILFEVGREPLEDFDQRHEKVTSWRTQGVQGSFTPHLDQVAPVYCVIITIIIVVIIITWGMFCSHSRDFRVTFPDSLSGPPSSLGACIPFTVRTSVPWSVLLRPTPPPRCCGGPQHPAQLRLKRLSEDSCSVPCTGKILRDV